MMRFLLWIACFSWDFLNCSINVLWMTYVKFWYFSVRPDNLYILSINLYNSSMNLLKYNPIISAVISKSNYITNSKRRWWNLYNWSWNNGSLRDKSIKLWNKPIVDKPSVLLHDPLYRLILLLWYTRSINIKLFKCLWYIKLILIWNWKSLKLIKITIGWNLQYYRVLPKILFDEIEIIRNNWSVIE